MKYIIRTTYDNKILQHTFIMSIREKMFSKIDMKGTVRHQISDIDYLDIHDVHVYKGFAKHYRGDRLECFSFCKHYRFGLK